MVFNTFSFLPENSQILRIGIFVPKINKRVSQCHLLNHRQFPSPTDLKSLFFAAKTCCDPDSRNRLLRLDVTQGNFPRLVFLLVILAWSMHVLTVSGFTDLKRSCSNNTTASHHCDLPRVGMEQFPWSVLG